MLEWHERKVNGIETNPRDCFWAVGSVVKAPRLYTIVEQYPSKNGYTVEEGSEPELYVLFEAFSSSGRRFSDTFENEREAEEWRYAEQFGDYLFKSRGSFVRAFKTLDEAKARAEVQIKAIQNIVDLYFSEDPHEEVS